MKSHEDVSGISEATLPVVRFLDDRKDVRWFYREHVELGHVRTLVGDAGTPIDIQEVLRVAREAFGDCSVLW